MAPPPLSGMIGWIVLLVLLWAGLDVLSTGLARMGVLADE